MAVQLQDSSRRSSKFDKVLTMNINVEFNEAGQAWLACKLRGLVEMSIIKVVLGGGELGT